MLSTFSFTDSLSFVSIAFSFSIWLIRFFKEVFSFFTFERRSININILDSSLSNFEISIGKEYTYPKFVSRKLPFILYSVIIILIYRNYKNLPQRHGDTEKKR